MTGFICCPGHRRQVLAHRDRPGERDQPHRGLRDQVFGDLGRLAEHQVQHARRQPGVDEGLHELHRAGRRLLRRLQDDRAPGGQRAADLAGRRAHREVPRRERGHHADRLAQHGMAHAGLAGDDAAIQAPPLLRVPFEDLAAPQDFELRLRDRLALLQGHRGGHLIGPLAHRLHGAENDLGPLGGRGAGPDLEPFLGRGQGIVEILAGRVRHDAEDAFIRRVDDRLTVAAPPLSADTKLQLGVIGHGESSCPRRNIHKNITMGAPQPLPGRSGQPNVKV